MSSASHIVLITGVDTEIGLALCLALAGSSQSYHMIMAAGSLDRVQSVVKNIKKQHPNSQSILDAIVLDLEDDETIQNAFEYISSEYDKIDSLVINAGAQFDFMFQADKLTMREAWNKAWAVSVTGTQIMIHTFLSLLLKSDSPRLLSLTYGMSCLRDSGFFSAQLKSPPDIRLPKALTPLTPYESVTFGLKQVMNEWARRLRKDDVKAFSISPGHYGTELYRLADKTLKSMGAGQPPIGAQFIKDVIEGGYDHQSGKALRSNEVPPSFRIKR